MMKKLYLLLFLPFFCSLNAQIITFPDSAFKAKLLESSPNNFIARNLNGDYFSIDSNSNNEIELALNNNYIPISLGITRLRTETAAIVACHSVVFANE